MKRQLSAVLGLLMFLSVPAGCGNSHTAGTDAENEELSSNEVSETSETSADAEEADSVQADSEMFTERDSETDYDESTSVFIELDGNGASATSDSVQILGTTITITEEATYIISGTLDDGRIVVDASDTAKIQLVLNGVDITSAASAPLYILEADKVFVTLADSTENTLLNGGSFTAVDENNIDSVVFSKQDLTFNGSGSLTVTSPAGHGIVSKDDLVITGGTYTITSASHGLDANDSIRITGETFLNIDAGKDGMHAENEEDTSLGFIYISDSTAEIEAEGDGISAGAYMQIQKGTFEIRAGGGSENGSSASSDSWGGFMGGNPSRGTEESADTNEDSSTSMKGIKAAADIEIAAGTFTIDSADDSVHSNASVTVNGGTFYIESGDDAFHADESLTVTAGTVNITECYEGLEALNIEIQGGEITLTAEDDGLNAAGGTDSSGTAGGRDAMFGGRGGMKGTPGGTSSSSDGSISISGGTLHIKSSGDGIDANGSIVISGGDTAVSGPVQGDTATLDYDTSASITGGTFTGTGASGMAQTFSEAEQGVIAVSVGEQSAGTTVAITDQNGNTVLNCTPELDFQVVIFSSPELVSGKTYTITAGEVSGELEAE